MSNYLEKLHANQIRFPEVYDQFLRNLFYMADSLKDDLKLATMLKELEESNNKLQDWPMFRVQCNITVLEIVC